jgi:hypothetical protein
MNYPDGQEVKLGDLVRLGQDRGGVVVCSIDTGQYRGEHSEAQWGYLKRGVMIQFPLYGLIHMEQPEADLELLARESARP